MRAVTWQGKRDVRVDEVPDPRIVEPTDAIVRITSTAICGSDLHLYEVLGPYIAAGDILGHEPMGIVRGSRLGGHQPRRRRPGGRARSTFPAAAAGCATAACSPSARPPRCGSRTRARHSSDTRRSTGRSRAARPSTCAFRTRLRADQGRRGRPGRAVPVPVRHPAHRMAGSAVRRCTRRRHPGRFRAGAGRPVRGPDRPAPGHRVIGVDPVPERREMAAGTASRRSTRRDR